MRTTSPRDDVALLEGLDRRVVVGNELAVDLDQEVGGAAVGRAAGGAGGRLGGRVGCRSRREPLCPVADDGAANDGNKASVEHVWRLALAAAPVPSTAVPRRETKRGAERTPSRGDVRRPHLRRQLRRPRRRPRARGLRRPHAGHRPLRDRRAPDLRLRGADRVARGDGGCGLDAPDLRHPRHPHAAHDGRLPASRGRSPPSTTASSAGCCGTSAMPSSRRQRSSGGCRARPDPVETDRGDRPRAARRRRARLEAGARRASATSRRRRRCRVASRCTRAAPATSSRSGSTATYVPAGYGWSFPARDEIRVGVGSFDPRFHVKEPTVELAEDLGREPVRLPGQLDPAPAARRRAATASSSSATRPATACR